jgi:hypothetical protein
MSVLKRHIHEIEFVCGLERLEVVSTPNFGEEVDSEGATTRPTKTCLGSAEFLAGA